MNKQQHICALKQKESSQGCQNYLIESRPPTRQHITITRLTLAAISGLKHTKTFAVAQDITHWHAHNMFALACT